MLRADAFARDVAGELVQIQRNGQPLFPAHFAVTLNLKIQCRLRTHSACLTRFEPDVTSLCSTTTLRGKSFCATRNSSSVQGSLASMGFPLAVTTELMASQNCLRRC